MPPTTVPAVEPYKSLAAVLPTQLDGYLEKSGAKATGPLDLDAAVGAEADTQAERALLETRKFENGYGRAFTDGTNDVYMAIYDFAGAQDASLYMTDGFITLYGRGASTYDVAEVPGAKGFSNAAEVDGRTAITHGVAFAKSDKFVLVFTRSPDTSTPSEATQLATTLFAAA